MLFVSIVGWITVLYFSGFSLNSVYINYNVSKIVQLGTYEIQVVIHQYRSLLIVHCLQTATLIYKFLHTGFPISKYLTPDLSRYSSSSCSARFSQCWQFPSQ